MSWLGVSFGGDSQDNNSSEDSNSSSTFDELYNWYHSEDMTPARRALGKASSDIVSGAVNAKSADLKSKTDDKNKKVYQNIQQDTHKNSFIDSNKTLLIAVSVAVLSGLFLFSRSKKG